MIGIYKIINPSGSIYIGQSWKIETRFKKYKCSLAKGQPRLHNSFKKYGIDNHLFTIEAEFPETISQVELDKQEVFFWKKYKSLGCDMMNVREPGNGGKMSEESKLKISIANKGKKHPSMYGPRSEETRKKIAESIKGRKLSENHCKKISLRNQGKVTHHKVILQYSLDGEFIKEFISICDAEREIGKKGANSNISACCKGRLKSCYGFIWKYKNKTL
jgi:group I intron endonuclease